MNPQYDNRTYYISHKGVFKQLLSDIAYGGNNVQGTREFANARIILPSVGALGWELDYEDIVLVNEVMSAIRAGDENMVNKIYDSKYYTFLKDELDNVKKKFRSDCVATRRAVFSFPSDHCFSSIQILIRGNEIITTVNMRSCNAYKNLICDLYLAHLLSFEASQEFSKGERVLIANIGSLHIFKEDIKDVLRNA